MATAKKAPAIPKPGETIFETPPGALRLQINDVELDADGGRIVLVGDNSQGNDTLTEDFKVTQVSVVINYRKDEPMRVWPSLREDIAKRRWTLQLIEAKPPE